MLDQMDFNMKNKINTNPTHISCINLNVKVKTINFIEKKQEYILGFGIGKDFLKHTKSTNHKRIL